jgi:hypothetical protein
MIINYKHNLNKEEAYTRLDSFLTELKDKYQDHISNLNQNWVNDDQMDFGVNIMGFNLNGSVYLKEHEVVLDGKLPFLARAFSSKIEEKIKENLENVLS